METANAIPRAPQQPASVSVYIGPRDARCRYWAKVIRAGAPLPLPSSVAGANDVLGFYSRVGDDELLPGDILIEGEENHHRKVRGWSYWVAWFDPVLSPETAGLCRVSPASTIKLALKAKGLAPVLLPGAGEVAACVRIAHAIRSGFGRTVLDAA